jgi:hypothetical protein
MPTELTRSTGANIARRLRGPGPMLAALAGAALIAGCGSSKSSSTSSTSKASLNTARVAKSIEDSIFAQRKLKYHVTCPATVPQEQGRTFECTATGLNAKHKRTSTQFLVTIQNNRGYVTYVGK